MAMENKRIIQLSTERTTLGDDDYTIVDSGTNGTAKYRLSRLKETDTTLSVSGMAADAAATGQAISEEAQARTQAVTAETQARQQAITAESQARQAADTALGNDVQDLKRALNYSNENMAESNSGLTKLISQNWIVGAAIANSSDPDGVVINNTIKYRVTTSSPIIIPKNTVFTIADGYRMFLYVDNGSGYYVAYGTWHTGTFDFANNSDVSAYVMISKSPESTSDIADVLLYTSKVLIKTEIKKQLDSLQTDVETAETDILQNASAISANRAYQKEDVINLSSGKMPIYSGTWGNGSITADNAEPSGIKIYTSAMHRVCTLAPIIVPADAVFYIKSGYRIFLFVDDGTGKYISNGAWRTGTYNLNNSEAVGLYVMISRDPETQENADVEAFVSMVLIDTAFQVQIDDALKRIQTIEGIVSETGDDVTLIKSGNNLTIKTNFYGSILNLSALVTQTDQNNPCFDFVEYTGAFSKIAVDDTCPLVYQGSYRCAGHGSYTAFELTCANHGLTASDIGKTYTLNGVTWVLITIIDSNHVWIMSNPYDSPTSAFVTTIDASGTLVGSNGNIVYTAAELRQVRPQNINREYKILVNNSEITEDGTYQGKSVSLTETYQSLNCPAMVEYLKNHVGENTVDSYYDPEIGGDLQYSVTYTFYPNSSCTVQETLQFLEGSKRLSFAGLVQAMRYSDTAYVPFSSYDTPTALTSETADLIPSTWNDPDFPPYKYYELNENAGNGFALGYDISSGMGLPNFRKTGINSAGSFNGSSHKMYPHFYGGTVNMEKGQIVSGNAVRMPVKIVNNGIGYYWHSGKNIIVEIEAFGETFVTVALPKSAIGKSVQIIKASSNIVAEEGIIAYKDFTVYASGSGSATFKIEG